jgi:Skp family chaperone for outer membrane proteins
MPKCVLGALVLLMVLPSSAAAQLSQSVNNADLTRIAYVSPQRAFYESNDGKAAQARLASLQSERSREVEARNTKLKTLQQELAQRASVLAETARREREQEIDRFQLDVRPSTSATSGSARRAVRLPC